jgi:hypothetical protein
MSSLTQTLTEIEKMQKANKATPYDPPTKKVRSYEPKNNAEAKDAGEAEAKDADVAEAKDAGEAEAKEAEDAPPAKKTKTWTPRVVVR